MYIFLTTVNTMGVEITSMHLFSFLKPLFELVHTWKSVHYSFDNENNNLYTHSSHVYVYIYFLIGLMNTIM